jgi:hypothetical protein
MVDQANSLSATLSPAPSEDAFEVSRATIPCPRCGGANPAWRRYCATCDQLMALEPVPAERPARRNPSAAPVEIGAPASPASPWSTAAQEPSPGSGRLSAWSLALVLAAGAIGVAAAGLGLGRLPAVHAARPPAIVAQPPAPEHLAAPSLSPAPPALAPMRPRVRHPAVGHHRLHRAAHGLRPVAAAHHRHHHHHAVAQRRHHRRPDHRDRLTPAYGFPYERLGGAVEEPVGDGRQDGEVNH